MQQIAYYLVFGLCSGAVFALDEATQSEWVEADFFTQQAKYCETDSIDMAQLIAELELELKLKQAE